MMLFRYGVGLHRHRRPNSPHYFRSAMARAYAGWPSTLITRGRTPDRYSAIRRNCLAATRSLAAASSLLTEADADSFFAEFSLRLSEVPALDPLQARGVLGAA